MQLGFKKDKKGEVFLVTIQCKGTMQKDSICFLIQEHVEPVSLSLHWRTLNM